MFDSVVLYRAPYGPTQIKQYLSGSVVICFPVLFSSGVALVFVFVGGVFVEPAC